MPRVLHVTLCGLLCSLMWFGVNVPLASGQEPTPGPDSHIQASDSTESKDAVRPACQDADDAFASHYDLYLLAFAVVFLFALPFALPLFGVRRWWIVAHPYHRWVVMTLLGVGLFFVIIFTPAVAVAVAGLPPRYAPVLAGVEHIYPSNCTGAGVSTAGFLWGSIGAGRELSILSLPKMTLAAVLAFSIAGILYWSVFLVVRRLKPLQAAR